MLQSHATRSICGAISYRNSLVGNFVADRSCMLVFAFERIHGARAATYSRSVGGLERKFMSTLMDIRQQQALSVRAACVRCKYQTIQFHILTRNTP